MGSKQTHIFKTRIQILREPQKSNSYLIKKLQNTNFSKRVFELGLKTEIEYFEVSAQELIKI